MVAELVLVAAAILALMAEWLHARRVRRLARLAFGPRARPAPWVILAPPLRVAAIAATAWGLTTLLTIPPKAHAAETLPDNQRRNILLVYDVSPSMRLKDAGPDHNLTRRKRAEVVMESFFSRVPIDQYFFSVVACYSGAKPVVVGTKDVEVIRNILDDLPMQYAFKAGKTDLFSGLIEADKIARPWRPKSTVLILISDGDTVPASGMPKLSASIADVLVVGVGDPRAGTFIDGGQSRQDVATLRQIATRLGGVYHDANEKHLPTDLIRRMTLVPRKGTFEQLTRREYALIACGLGSSLLAILPLLLHHLGTLWRPGVPERRASRNGDGRRRTAVVSFEAKGGENAVPW
jgi:Ca-activated chloride channel family protein